MKSQFCDLCSTIIRVTPYAGVWIEMIDRDCYSNNTVSLPTRECGLKFYNLTLNLKWTMVTPYAGVWIEMVEKTRRLGDAWSLPTRECGLKLK